MALRRFGVGPSAADSAAALRETEKAAAERDAEARAAFEATFKRANRVPPTLAPTGRRVRDAKQFDRFDDDATARGAARAGGGPRRGGNDAGRSRGRREGAGTREGWRIRGGRRREARGSAAARRDGRAGLR